MTLHLFEEAPDQIEALVAPGEILFAFDFDGTLSAIAPTPEEARLHPAVEEALAGLQSRTRAGIHTAVVSGRPVSQLRDLVPAVELRAGLHGLELQRGSEPARLLGETERTDAALDRIRARLAILDSTGARIEDKGHALAVHVRGLDAAVGEHALATFERLVDEERRRDGARLECLRGKAVAEARPADARKDRAVAELLRLSGASRLFYAGDDRTDEDVFSAFPDAWTVAVMDPARETRARFLVRDPDDLAHLIHAITDRLAPSQA